MIHKDIFAVCLTTIYFFIYLFLLQFESALDYAVFMLLLSPFMIVWMVYTVLKSGHYKGRDLGDNEFGYQDRNNNELGIF